MAGLYEAPSMNTIKINQFRGIDVSVPEDQVKLFRATDALNMIPDATGQIRKRPGVQMLGEELQCPIEKVLEGRCRLLGKNLFDENSKPILQYWNGEEYCDLFECIGNLLLIPHGEKALVLAWQTSYPVPPIGGLGAVQGEVYGALLAVLEEEGAYLYTDSGTRYTYKGGVWSSTPIPSDDPRLTVPRMMIGCDYRGGGTPYEYANLLNPWVCESFCIKKETKVINEAEEIIGAAAFHLNGNPFTEGIALTNGAIYDVDILNSIFKVEVQAVVTETMGGETFESLEWMERPFGEGDGYRVETRKLWLNPSNNKAADGTVLGTAYGGKLGPAPLEGEDNVRITYRRAEFSQGMNGLCKATCATFYGVGGYKDRLFLGLGNRIYYSELSDALYIGDLDYLELDPDKRVEILSGIASKLAIITDSGVCFAAGQESNGEEGSYAADAIFTLSTRIPAPAPVSGSEAAVLGGEIVYLSKDGVIALTSKDQYDERYAEHRSATVDKKMLEDEPRFLTSFGRYLLIFCKNGICWLLDENQPNTEGNKPYAAHQYEGYRMSGFEANCAFCNSEGKLILARGGALYQWMDGKAATDYRDMVMEGAAGTEEGRNKVAKAIEAYWETPWITGTTFHKNKIFRRIGLLLDHVPGVNAAIRVEGKKNDEEWKELLGYDGALCTFHYGTFNYRFFTYQTKAGNSIIRRKIKIKKATRFKLRFCNDIIDQALILNQCALDYVQED